MPRIPLFSTYRQGENRVTSSMLAVFERIDLGVLESLLGSATGEASLQLVAFVNQPAGRGDSIPDARISAHFSYWFEVKTARNVLGGNQLAEHLLSLDGGDPDERLIVITPDTVEPPAISELNDRRVSWFNFRSLYDAIEGMLGDNGEDVSEHVRFLLRELQALLVEEGLVDNDDVVVVAARMAYPEYLKHGVYVCQPDRPFRDGLTHMAFYTDGAIQKEVPQIIERVESVKFTFEEAERRRADSGGEDRVADAIDTLLGLGLRIPGSDYGVFVLSPHDSGGTVRLDAPIVNDKLAASGRPFAWTLGKRYTSLTRMAQPGISRTSQLEAP